MLQRTTLCSPLEFAVTRLHCTVYEINTLLYIDIVMMYTVVATEIIEESCAAAYCGLAAPIVFNALMVKCEAHRSW